MGDVPSVRIGDMLENAVGERFRVTEEGLIWGEPGLRLLRLSGAHPGGSIIVRLSDLNNYIKVYAPPQGGGTIMKLSDIRAVGALNSRRTDLAEAIRQAGGNASQMHIRVIGLGDAFATVKVSRDALIAFLRSEVDRVDSEIEAYGVEVDD